jgi:hypothetical protein
MSGDYDIREFFRSRKQKPLSEILADTRAEEERIKYVSVRVKGAVAAKEAGSVAYLYALERFEEFINTNAFPRRTNRNEAILFFSILKTAVERGELPAGALKIESQIEHLPTTV